MNILLGRFARGVTSSLHSCCITSINRGKGELPFNCVDRLFRDQNNFIALHLRILVLSVIAAPASTVCLAQGEVDNTDLASWNDLEVTVGINKKLDLNTVTTLRLDDNISRVDSYRFTVGVTVRPNSSFSLAPFTTFISSRNSAGRFRYEYRSGLKAVYKFPVKGFGLSHRSQIEHRSRPGRNSWRYRPSITLEKDLPESFAKGASVFFTVEPIYDSVSERFSRTRYSGGMEKSLNKKLAIELYYLFQGDNVSTPGSVHVLGTALKVKL